MRSPQPFAQFKRTVVPHGGQRVRGYQIECGNCHAIATAAVNTFTNHEKEEAFVVSKFRGMAWKVGNSAQQNRCPGCFAKIRNAAANKSGENKVVILHPDAAVNPPQSMGRDDRRIIFEKLNEVYVSEKVGYGDGWTDKRVSTELGCALAWVKTVRDEMFGPEGANESIRATIAEAQSIFTEIKEVGGRAETIVDELKKLVERAGKIEKAVIQIEKELR